MNINSFRYHTTKIILLAILFSSTIHAQVYNYDPIRQNNSETNPANLALEKNKRSSGYIHQGSFFFNRRFHYDAFRLSWYNSKYNCGIGLVVNNTQVGDSIAYKYIGLGAAYRTILLNKVNARFGFMCKMHSVQSPDGVFTYYSFLKEGEGNSQERIIVNSNFSMSLSTGGERLYASLGVLNSQLLTPGNYRSQLFPEYYFINIGDFARLLHLTNWQLSYTGFVKKQGLQNSLSHYFTLLNELNFTRTLKIRYGMRAGISDNQYIHCNPVLTLICQETRKGFCRNCNKKIRETLSCQLLLDFGIATNHSQLPFQPTSQININYQF